MTESYDINVMEEPSLSVEITSIFQRNMTFKNPFTNQKQRITLNPEQKKSIKHLDFHMEFGPKLIQNKLESKIVIETPNSGISPQRKMNLMLPLKENLRLDDSSIMNDSFENSFEIIEMSIKDHSKRNSNFRDFPHNRYSTTTFEKTDEENSKKNGDENNLYLKVIEKLQSKETITKKELKNLVLGKKEEECFFKYFVFRKMEKIIFDE